MNTIRFAASTGGSAGTRRSRRTLIKHAATLPPLGDGDTAANAPMPRADRRPAVRPPLRGDTMPLAIEPVVKSVDLSTGVRLPYVEQGDPTGTPVVLLHGVTDSWRSFEPVLPHLPASLHVFALTQRGHGDAERPAEGYRFEDFSADLAAFIDAVGLAQAVVVGTSMGSSVAQRFAIDYPDRTLGNVLMAAFAGYSHNPIVVEFAEVVATLTDPIDPAFAREFQETTLARPIPAAWLATFVRESLKVPARVWRAAFAGFVEDDTEAEFGKIASPTLVIWGDQDAFTPERDQEALVAAIAGSRLTAYRGHGHAIHWEEPARVAADIVAFVEGLGH